MPGNYVAKGQMVSHPQWIFVQMGEGLISEVLCYRQSHCLC